MFPTQLFLLVATKVHPFASAHVATVSNHQYIELSVPKLEVNIKGKQKTPTVPVITAYPVKAYETFYYSRKLYSSTSPFTFAIHSLYTNH